MGATHVINPDVTDDPVAALLALTDGTLADAAVDMVGHQGGTMELCSKLTKPEGLVLLFGLPPQVRCMHACVSSRASCMHGLEAQMHLVDHSLWLAG